MWRRLPKRGSRGGANRGFPRTKNACPGAGPGPTSRVCAAPPSTAGPTFARAFSGLEDDFGGISHPSPSVQAFLVVPPESGHLGFKRTSGAQLPLWSSVQRGALPYTKRRSLAQVRAPGERCRRGTVFR